MDRKMSQDLDRHITGNYGEDQFNRPMAHITELTPGKLTKKGYENAKKILNGVYDTYCKIEPLSGGYEEGIFLATFNDDTRQLYEANDGELRLMPTKDQQRVLLEGFSLKDYEQMMAVMVLRHWEWRLENGN
jgi:hypothetical protein